jgi:hypothetical protein
MTYANPEFINFALFFRDFILGLLGLSLVLVFHGSCVMRIIAGFELKEVGLVASKKYTSLIFSVYNALSLFAVVHIIGVLIWATILYASQLIATPINAILFAGSCYLTLGFIGDVLPEGWKSLALFISFSGLFSTAWTTSAMVGLTDSYKIAWVKRKQLNEEKSRNRKNVKKSASI